MKWPYQLKWNTWLQMLRGEWKGKREGEWAENFVAIAKSRGRGTTQELVHVKHDSKEILGLLSNQIVKSRRKMRKLSRLAVTSRYPQITWARSK